MEELLSASSQTINTEATHLWELGHEIWRNPELGLQEFHAHKLLCNFMRERGFTVEEQFLGSTGFRASYSNPSSGGEGVHLCLLAEYDALPELGHASGRNLITESCVATALALKAVIEKKKGIGKVTVLGTPDSEGNGKKIEAIHSGLFKDVDLAASFNPFTVNVAKPTMLTIMRLTIRFKGKAAHASSCPWDGRNALDAAVLCYNNISVLRQQLKPFMQIHGVISNGGVKPNIIPEHTEMVFYLRARDHVDMAHLQQRANAAFHAAAKATGCELEFDFTPTPYSNLCSNAQLASLYQTQAEGLGMEFTSSTDMAATLVGSSDTGNVSHVVPTLAPAFDIAPAAVATNTQAFAEIAGSEEAHKRALVAAKAMARTLIMAAMDPTIMTSIKNGFEADSCAASMTQWH
ncbi:peptidase M20 domain-containing protein 2-like [Diadema antillarum]|uniref:peptidase M20 domain-containing protein 2-like n=1 Tax=Diadema antillarum TaxID=105358 RepID=UPI003A85DD29